MFWADSSLDQIEVMSLRGSLNPGVRRVLAETNQMPLVHPRGLALDERMG